MLRHCCCLGGGPAAFIIIGPDEDGYADYTDTLDKQNCNPFCLMDEDIIHPVVKADDYQIDNDYVYEEEDPETGEMVRFVRIGLEMFLRPKCACARLIEYYPGRFKCEKAVQGTDGNIYYSGTYCGGNCEEYGGPNPGIPPGRNRDTGESRSIPQCYDLPFERFDYVRPLDSATLFDECDNPNQVDGGWEEAVIKVHDEIVHRYGPQILGYVEDENGVPDLEKPIMNPYPTQIWLMIDTSGSHTWADGEPLVQGLVDKFKEEYGEDIAEKKFNPCLDGGNCTSYGCCDEEECGESYCYTRTGVRKYTFEMSDENFMSCTLDLMRIHFAEGHCDQEKLDACEASDCWNCNDCDTYLPCRDCLGI